MAIVKTDDAHYKGIADAIRSMHGKGTTYTPPEMVAFLTAGGVNVKPEYIAKGITMFGVEGTLEFPVSEEFPPDLPVTEEDMDAEVFDDDPEAPVEDKFVLIDDNGNITTGYMYGGDFEITFYDPVTTEFRARGWRRVSYHTTGEHAGKYTRGNFRTEESGGWNYLKNIRMCTREKLYYNGMEVWPSNAYLYKLGLLTGTTAQKSPSAFAHTNTWVAKTWSGLTSFSALDAWSDGNNIYYSIGGEQYVLNGDTWEEKTWNGLTEFWGYHVWSDGTNTYFSTSGKQYVLNGDTWEEKTWNKPEEFDTAVDGAYIWTDGKHTYHSKDKNHYVLNGDTWEKLSWDMNVSTHYRGGFGGIWSDGANIYYSVWTYHYVLNGDTWEEKTWNISFWGNSVWTDGTNIYCGGASASDEHYILKDGVWEEMVFANAPNDFSDRHVWSDGTNVYHSDGSIQYVLK